jgi:hypothetical protein
MALLKKQATMTHVHAFRLDVLEKGYWPIPCKGKYPARFEGWSQCRASPANIAAWDETHPENTNTGILTGELVALDIDILRPELAAALTNMVREMPGGTSAPMRVGKAPKALFIFRTDEPREKIASDWFRIDGVDQRIEVLGNGQQFIADGIHPETKAPYTWDRDIPSFNDLPLVDWPSLERLLQDASALLADRAEERKPAPVARKAANDNGSDSYFRRVNQAALEDLPAWVPALELPKTKPDRNGYRAVCAWRGVRNANLSFHPNGITDWGSGESHTAIDVVTKAGKGDGPASAAEWLCTRLGKAKEELGWIDKGAALMPPPGAIAALIARKEKPVDISNPFTAEAVGGIMGEIAEWIIATSRRKSPEFAVMASLAFMSAMYGRRVVGPTGCGVNLYLAGIAGPGFGKEAPLQRLVRALHDTDMAFLVGAGEVSSASAIEKILRRKPAVVMPWDEIGDVFEAINARGSGNWAATIRKAMLELYSKSVGVWFGKETTDEDRLGTPIYCPSLTIIGTSTPARFYGGLSEKNLADGLAARMIFIAPTKRPERARHTDADLRLPESIAAKVKSANESFPWPGLDSPGKWRSADMEPHLAQVPWAETAAEDAWLAIEDWQESEIERDDVRDGIVGRFAENAIRIATLRALSRSANRASVTVEDVAWARSVMMESIRAVDLGVEKFMVSSKFDEICQAILSALRSTKNGEMYRAELLKRRGVRGAESRMFEDAVKRLQETGDIERTDGKKLVLTPAGR